MGGGTLLNNVRTVGRDHDVWHVESEEEFLGMYRQGFDRASFSASAGEPTLSVDCWSAQATIRIDAKRRADIERLIAVFDRHAAESLVPEPPAPRPVIFIGHGKDTAWRDLKDHLQDQHGYDVIAYETGARAGHTIRDVLERMADEATFAILVMTAEDVAVDAEGRDEARARQNVVHEVGLFQGRLGWDRAVVAIENDVALFSNLQGINQIRFSKGNVREVFGDVLATLRREFGT